MVGINVAACASGYITRIPAMAEQRFTAWISRTKAIVIRVKEPSIPWGRDETIPPFALMTPIEHSPVPTIPRPAGFSVDASDNVIDFAKFSGDIFQAPQAVMFARGHFAEFFGFLTL